MKKFLFLIIIIAVANVGFYFWWTNGAAPVDPLDKSKKSFVISSGQSTRDIVDQLKTSGLIQDPIVFFLLIKKEGVDGKIQAGEFTLSPSMSAWEILEKLQLGLMDTRITIPEGKRAQEVAKLLEPLLMNYSADWGDALEQYEGYLFPDTYAFAKNASLETVIDTLTGNFDKKYAEVVNNTNLSREQIVILASLIEREAKHDADRPMVSSVIHNRLKIGMKLDIDATVQYAVGFNARENSWWKRDLTYDDTDINSAYNTYNNPGLPPGPIANPGLESLQAAANPATSNYLYYISDKQGNNHYATTFAEHNKNIIKYGQ